MAASTSVLAFLATRFATSPENLATEALNFILASSPAASRAMVDLCRQLGCEEAVDLAFSTQATIDDGSRPDLVGHTVDGRAPVMVEAKFWAGLTDRQPGAYLRELREGGLLLFVAPAARTDTLWLELRRRAGLESDPSPAASTPSLADVRTARVGSRTLALVSWRVLLASLRGASEQAREAATADIQQLESLCEKMDTDAFLPLRAEELTSDLGRRVRQFCDLADRVTDLLVSKSLAEVKGLRATGGKGWFGRYMRFRGHGAFLHFDARRWARHGHSPLWLAVYGRNFKECTVEPDCLRAADIVFYRSKGRCMVPLFLREGVELDAVVDHALEQIQRVMAIMPDLSREGDAVLLMPDDPDMVVSSEEAR
jgi:hypothetical protein